jgi:hypothetical protein
MYKRRSIICRDGWRDAFSDQAPQEAPEEMHAGLSETDQSTTSVWYGMDGTGLQSTFGHAIMVSLSSRPLRE